jgi:hypothetical protein
MFGRFLIPFLLIVIVYKKAFPPTGRGAVACVVAGRVWALLHCEETPPSTLPGEGIAHPPLLYFFRIVMCFTAAYQP